MRTKFEYAVSTEDTTFATGLYTRQDARSVLAEVKEAGFTDAKIYQQEYVFIKSKQVR